MEKRDYKHGTFTLATTDTDGWSYEDYKEWCEDNGIEPEDENSDGFWEWCREETDLNWESDLENIKSCKEYDVPCIITGTLGLWWGRPTIKPERMESVYDAILRCIGEADIVTVQWNDGVVTVDAYHHDGCNCFTIKALSKKGIAKQYAEYKDYDTKRLPYLYAIGI